MKMKKLVYYALISALTYGAYYIWFNDDTPTPEQASASEWKDALKAVPQLHKHASTSPAEPPARPQADPAVGAPDRSQESTAAPTPVAPPVWRVRPEPTSTDRGGGGS